jgi:hypothetical protein
LRGRREKLYTLKKESVKKKKKKPRSFPNSLQKKKKKNKQKHHPHCQLAYHTHISPTVTILTKAPLSTRRKTAAQPTTPADATQLTLRAPDSCCCLFLLQTTVSLELKV